MIKESYLQMPAMVRKPMKMDSAIHIPTKPAALYKINSDPMLPVATRI